MFRVLLFSPVLAFAFFPNPGEAQTRPDPMKLSFGYIPKGELAAGEVRVIETPHGKIRCVGGNSLPGKQGTAQMGNRSRDCRYIK